MEKDRKKWLKVPSSALPRSLADSQFDELLHYIERQDEEEVELKYPRAIAIFSICLLNNLPFPFTS